MKKKVFLLMVVFLVCFIAGCTKAGTKGAESIYTISGTENTNMNGSNELPEDESNAPKTEDINSETEKSDDGTKGDNQQNQPNSKGSLVIYPEFPDRINRVYGYDVSVTMGSRTEKIPVYNHTEESNVSRRSAADIYRRFSCFAFDGEGVRVDIKVKTDFTSYTVFPSAKKFKHEFKDGVISVFLDKPDYFGIQLDEDPGTILSVIADLPETDIPSKGAPNVIWIDGWYEPEGTVLNVTRAGTTVYLAPGSVLNGRIKIQASDCKVIGRGAIVDPYENIYKYDIRDGETEWYGVHPLETTNNVSSFTGDGFFMLDSRKYNIRANGKGITLTHIKLFSSLMTSDGFSMQCTNSKVEHCFCYVGDNALVAGRNNNLVFRDVTVGTTCAALFPERTGDNILFEDINIFRADDGIINHWCNNGIEQKIGNVVLRRVNAVEMQNGEAHLFGGRNMGTLEKIFTFEDISLPEFDAMLYFENGNSYLYTDNYTFNFKNVSVGGEVLTKKSQVTVNNAGKMNYNVNITSASGFEPVKRDIETVNYKADNKIYIGQRQIFLSDIKKDGGKLMMPTAEICKLLRVDKISNDEYVSEDDLKLKNAVLNVKKTDSALYLTPIYNGENILLPDEGESEISRFAENSCFQVDLVTSVEDGKTVYNIYEFNSKNLNAGIVRQITDEVRMYGVGTYCISFSAKASEAGAIKIYVGQNSSDFSRVTKVDTSWHDFSFDFTIDKKMIDSPKCVISFVWSEKKLDCFSLRDITLTKKK